MITASFWSTHSSSVQHSPALEQLLQLSFLPSRGGFSTSKPRVCEACCNESPLCRSGRQHTVTKSVPTLPVPSADIWKNVRLTVHPERKNSEFWGHPWCNSRAIQALVDWTNRIYIVLLMCRGKWSAKFTFLAAVWTHYVLCNRYLEMVKFVILIQRKGVIMLMLLCSIWNSVTIICLIVLSNCKVICSDYLLDYIAVTLKFV